VARNLVSVVDDDESIRWTTTLLIESFGFRAAAFESAEGFRSVLQGEFRVARNLVSVVDDDESVRRTTTLLIESFGFRAAAFESAEGFLRSGQLHDTACLIVDVQMPGMNGLQLQSHLAAAGCGIPIIFITAYDDRESRGRAMQAGAVAFLGKPFSDEQLFQTIRSTLRTDKGGTKTT
jgi:FixJ family two-component response regulator